MSPLHRDAAVSLIVFASRMCLFSSSTLLFTAFVFYFNLLLFVIESVEVTFLGEVASGGVEGDSGRIGTCVNE